MVNWESQSKTPPQSPEDGHIYCILLIRMVFCGCMNAFLAAALSRVMRAAVPIPAVAAASVLDSAAVGGFVTGDMGPF